MELGFVPGVLPPGMTESDYLTLETPQKTEIETLWRRGSRQSSGLTPCWRSNWGWDRDMDRNRLLWIHGEARDQRDGHGGTRYLYHFHNSQNWDCWCNLLVLFASRLRTQAATPQDTNRPVFDGRWTCTCSEERIQAHTRRMISFKHSNDTPHWVKHV